MKSSTSLLSKRYRAALERHLKRGDAATLKAAQGLGRAAVAAGVQTLNFAKVHEEIMVKQILPRFPRKKRAALIKQAGIFFGVAIAPSEDWQRTSSEETGLLKKFITSLSRRTVELAASNRELIGEITQRKAAEEALKNSQRHYAQLLHDSDQLQEELRRLSRQVLSAQEDERRTISRELHDVIAQTLTGINIRLATLKDDAISNPEGLSENIALTQGLVAHSVSVIHQFARELRPAVLDDLGLIPALHSFVTSFSKESGLRVSLTVFAGVEKLENTKRIVLYRVTQEALTNVARHARASHVKVDIEKVGKAASLRIQDNGRSFSVDRLLRNGGNKRLGLLGMRERVEMVGGRFGIESTPDQGTTVSAVIPLSQVNKAKAAAKKRDKF